jgi:pyrroline-5-carboxylate reductase
MAKKLKLENRRVAFIGGGHITEIIVGALMRKGTLSAENLIVSDPRAERLEHLHRKYGVATANRNPAAADFGDYVFVNVRPNVVNSVIEELRQTPLSKEKVIISLAAGVPISKYRPLGDTVPVIRALPNPPSQIGMGIVAVSYNQWLTAQKLEDAFILFSSLGEYVVLDEEFINVVTALSTPAISYLFFQALVDAGVRSGLDSRTAIKIVSKTIMGSMEVWKRRKLPPYELLEEASTPGGVSVECVFTLEKHAFRAALSEAICNGATKAAQLGHQESED